MFDDQTLRWWRASLKEGKRVYMKRGMVLELVEALLSARTDAYAWQDAALMLATIMDLREPANPDDKEQINAKALVCHFFSTAMSKGSPVFTQPIGRERYISMLKETEAALRKLIPPEADVACADA